MKALLIALIISFLSACTVEDYYSALSSPDEDSYVFGSPQARYNRTMCELSGKNYGGNGNYYHNPHCWRGW